ncbi:MAG: sarcosine oxidase subunit delta [Pseudomonadota bacterium]
MRITCPYCGDRDVREFHYRGAEGFARPDPDDATTTDAFPDYVYLRDNPAGVIDEHWVHHAGCRSWLVVTRDTRTHQIETVRFAGRQKQQGRS